jgi:hypothetical protein
VIGVDERRLFAEVLRIWNRITETAHPLSQVESSLADLILNATAATVHPQAELPFLHGAHEGDGIGHGPTCPYSVTSSVHQLGANKPIPTSIRHMNVITVHTTMSDLCEIRLQFCFLSDVLSPSMSTSIDDRLQVLSFVCDSLL